MSETRPALSDDEREAQAIRGLATAYARMREEIGKVIIGQTDVVDQLLIALFSRGHCLLVGVPGLAKTLLVSTVSRILQLSFRRIQFTPDLMPSDITGTDVLQDDPQTGRRAFQFTQAPLLEAMQERHVTVGSHTYRLPNPFFVLATQNPIEQEGTYPLPEAQLDRFMFMIKVDYPSLDEEREILRRTTGGDSTEPEKVLGVEDLLEIQRVVRSIPAADHVLDYALALTRGT